jgi:hypothetical protein
MEIDLNLDKDNLYREESFTDMKVGAIRRLTPVTPEGEPDNTRGPVFIGHTQLMSPQGPLPVTCQIEAKTILEAMGKFPEAVQQEVERIVAAAQKAQAEESSRIVVPGQ